MLHIKTAGIRYLMPEHCCIATLLQKKQSPGHTRQHHVDTTFTISRNDLFMFCPFVLDNLVVVLFVSDHSHDVSHDVSHDIRGSGAR